MFIAFLAVMRCFLVVNQLNDPVFLDFDLTFASYINKRAVELGLQEAEYQQNGSQVDTTLVMQLFSPLVLSQFPLANQIKNPCSSIVCPNGFVFAFKQVDDIQYIAINGDGTESIDFLQKKILIFIRISKFLFGPVYSEISSSTIEKEARWKFLRSLLETWTHLATNDQSFLVEALERLYVNQLVSEKCVELLEKTLHKVQSSAEHPTQHAFLLINTKLLALYSKRNSFELQPADILLTILLAKDIFPSKDVLENMLGTPSPLSSRKRQQESKASRRTSSRILEAEERSEDGEEEYHSVPTTPSGTRSQTPGTETDPESVHILSTTPSVSVTAITSGAFERERGDSDVSDVRRGGSEEDCGLERLGEGAPLPATWSKTNDSVSSVVETDAGYPPLSPQGNMPQSDLQTTGLLFGLNQHESGQRRGTSTEGRDSGSSGHPTTSSASDQDVMNTGVSQSAQDMTSTSANLSTQDGGSTSPGATEQSLQSGTTDELDYWPHTVFLQTSFCQYSPHALHCTQILPGITLVVVGQVSKAAVADHLCQILTIVQDILQGRRDKLNHAQSLHVHDVLSSLLDRVMISIKKIKGRVDHLSRDIQTRWESEEFKRKITGYLEQDTLLPMLPDLESPLMEWHRKLKELFQLLFLFPGACLVDKSLEAGRAVVSKMKVRMQQDLMDYRDFLNVRAQRNITMTSYLDDFPGLVHFIYIDRHHHHVIAPSLNVVLEHGKTNATNFFKEKIWKMYAFMMKKLHEGHTTVLIRDGDFYYSYFLWFEDSMGNQLSVQEPYKPSIETPLPGMLTGNFYRRLMRHCFPTHVNGTLHCYEMFMMHLGLLTPNYIAGHCPKLARKLWEMSGEAFTPVNLL